MISGKCRRNVVLTVQRKSFIGWFLKMSRYSAVVAAASALLRHESVRPMQWLVSGELACITLIQRV